jgi:hypothetical protein
VDEDLRRCSRAFKAGAFSARELVDAVGGPAALLRAIGWWQEARSGGFPSIPFMLRDFEDGRPVYPVKVNLLPEGAILVLHGPHAEGEIALAHIEAYEGDITVSTYDTRGEEFNRTAVRPVTELRFQL